jgi:tRNA 2-selenouridine synthase
MKFPPLEKIDISRFLDLAENIPVVDVRSPSEYNTGHIPGAFNIPLFDDKERETAGIKYKKEGRSKAIIAGIELAGPKMHLKLQEALKIAKNGKLLVHCWRGGMRSEAMAWLFLLGDIDTEILNRGYKAYRNYILSALSGKRKTIILGGMTGSSKTLILRHLKKQGQQVVDLEKLANHKGSAFGALGQPPQPSSEYFANLLFNEWKQINKDLPVWIEDESRNIGNVFMPDDFYNNLQDSPTIILLMEVKERLPGLMEEYSTYPPELLKGSIMKISKRLGGDKTKDALDAVDKDDLAKAVEIVLKYYDKAYLYGIKRKNRKNLISLKTETDDIEINAGLVLNAATKIVW